MVKSVAVMRAIDALRGLDRKHAEYALLLSSEWNEEQWQRELELAGLEEDFWRYPH
jgi:hypothetical protein